MSDSNWGTDAPMWRSIPPPFMPSDADVALLQAACPPELMHEGAAPRILVLGVTPALVEARWPARAELHAVDFDQGMIEVLWRPREGRHCHCAYWQDMPFDDGFFDLVVGDCSFNALPDTAEYDAVLREIARVSRPGAPLVARFFMQAEPRLTLADLPRAANAEFAHFGPAAKRLLIPIAASGEDGSNHAIEIPAKIERAWGPVEEFLAELGLAGEDKERALRTFTFDQRLNYPARKTIAAIFGRWYAAVGFAFPDYDCGGFCPTVSCTRAG